MTKNRFSIKFISAFMAFLVTFVAIPVQAFALDFNETEVVVNNPVDPGEEIKQEVFIVEEDLSKRGQFEKHYLCSDGTYVSVTYPEAIHYLDDNNQWQDVDQSLTYDTASGMYISDKADFEVSFSNKVSSTNIARIERNGYILSWGIQTTQKNVNDLSRTTYAQSEVSAHSSSEFVVVPTSSTTATVAATATTKKENNSDRLLSDKDSFALPKISAQISYTDIFAGTQNVSLKYTVYHNKVEEDIIISERGDLQSVSMNMDAGTLTPIVNADGSVDLVDSNNEMQFHIGIPYMVDAEHSVCNDIQVTAVKKGTSCIITYTPNAEWFESSERVFPILLDPSITTNDYVSNIEDTYVEQNTTTNHSSEQYLYFTPNEENGNRRNVIVRVTKLPEIDASMPIISAMLTLTAEYSPFSDVSLMAKYLDTGLELNDYDYGVTTNDYFAYTAYSYLNAGSTQVIFDFSSHIYEMYSDLEYDEEFGYDYHGDFVIGYSDSTDTTYAYPFFSSEYTVPSNRPVFTVKYGYSLPAGMLDGGVYSFKNVGSYSYMSVNDTSPSNIYQTYNINSIATESQKFKLVYIASTGGYMMRSMNSSVGQNKVVSIDMGDEGLISDLNVRLSTTTEAETREWLIIPVDYDVFRIVPRGNMSLTLATNGMDDGSNEGTSSTSPGNIFVQTYAENNSYQEWYISNNNDVELNTAQYRAAVETGNYFIGNDFTGKYLHRSGNNVDGMSGMISDLGEETVKWRIVNLGDGYCTIQRSDRTQYYLAPISSTSGSGISVYRNVNETIPDNYKWSIRSASGGGCIIQHKTSGLYLSGISSTANPSSICIYALNTPGTDAYSKQVWRVANEDYYVELGVTTSFNDISVDIGKSQNASINKNPSNASWASYTDFDYTIIGSGNVSYNSNTHTFTGILPGVALISATHKTTGLTQTFEVVTDCFDPRCIEYVRYTRIVGANAGGLGTTTDHTIGIVKSSLKEDEFCIISDNIYETSREFIIDAELRNTLNALEASYQDKYNIVPILDQTTIEEKAAHSSKLETDQLVEKNYFSAGSSEYYGAWAYNYISSLNILDRFQIYMETYTAIYAVYMTAMSFYYSYLASTNTSFTNVSSSDYYDTMTNIDDIDDALSGMSYTNKKVITAEIRNNELANQGYNNPLPYKPNTPVYEIQHTESTQYVRVYVDGQNQTGKWLMKYSDIQGLTPQQIQTKFALPNIPTHYCFVDVPEGTCLYVGLVNQSSVTGTIQYELITYIPNASFGQGILLP